jgi:hypothetical protein
MNSFEIPKGADSAKKGMVAERRIRRQLQRRFFLMAPIRFVKLRFDEVEKIRELNPQQWNVRTTLKCSGSERQFASSSSLLGFLEYSEEGGFPVRLRAIGTLESADGSLSR